MKRKNRAFMAWEEMALPQNQKYYDRLHDKIMAKIEEAEMEIPPTNSIRSSDNSYETRFLRPSGLERLNSGKS